MLVPPGGGLAVCRGRFKRVRALAWDRFSTCSSWPPQECLYRGSISDVPTPEAPNTGYSGNSATTPFLTVCEWTNAASAHAATWSGRNHEKSRFHAAIFRMSINLGVDFPLISYYSSDTSDVSF